MQTGSQTLAQSGDSRQWARTTDRAAAGAVIAGRYTLIESVGAGGMGEVWVADQTEPVKRKVALKLIKSGLDSRAVLQRFEAERQALAVMDHPNIARVLDGGLTDERQPFFVMELVAGSPLTKFCDNAKLAIRERLELFVAICQAVQHAHTKGIVHRDLKPANILVATVDGRPAPKIIDFGLAKALQGKLTDESLHTEFGAVIGTLEYMAPEQAEGASAEVDTRADIYSLGVILYELLTGLRPFDAKRLRRVALLEMVRTIREEEPLRPSSRLSTEESLPSLAAVRQIEPARLTKMLRGDLDWVVMKCLEKQPNRRYETANGLAREIERYLADEAVEASPPSVMYRLQKFVRRNKWPVIAGTSLVLALTAGAAVSTWQAVRASHARAEAIEALEATSRQRERAEAAAEKERTAKQLAESRQAETQAVLDFLQNRILAAARPKDQEGGLGSDVKLRDALHAALPFLDQGFADQPSIEAQLRVTIGMSFLHLGQAAIAAQSFQRALGLRESVFGLKNAETLHAMNRLGVSFASLGRHADARELFEKTWELRKALLGEDHRDTLSSMNNLALSYVALGRFADALQLIERALVLQRKSIGFDDPETLKSLNSLAICQGSLGRFGDAAKTLDELIALQTAKLGGEHPDTLKSMANLAVVYYELGDFSKALAINEKVLAIRRAKLGPDHPHTLWSMTTLANNYAKLNRHAEALKLGEEVLALSKAKLGPDHPDTLNCMHNLAISYADVGRHEDSLRLRQETVALRTAKLGADHPSTLSSKHNLANGLSTVGKHAEALKLREETLAARIAKLGPLHFDTFKSRKGVAESLLKLQKEDQALAMIDETLRLLVQAQSEGKQPVQRLLPELFDLRMQAQRQRNDVAGCRETAEKWEALNRTDAESLYTAGRFRAITATIAKSATGNDAEKAVDWLQKSIPAGLKNRQRIARESEFEILNDRDDFKKLLANLNPRDPAPKP
jgi:serine/threonine protein kinase/tetratricopeptide (TPR) repeat protein